MTVASEISRLQTAKADMKTALEAKGVTVGTAKLDEYDTLIASIPSGVDISDADAAVGDVLTAKTFYATSGGKKTGTMPDNGTVSTDISAVATEVTIAAGKHSGSGVVKISATEQAKIIAGNIKKDITILGVTGNVESIPDPALFKVQFFDYDGTLLKTQYVASGANATPPTAPTHDLLTFDSWNHPCTNITKDENVGAIYNTTDGKTYIFATFNVVTGLKPTISVNKSTTALMTVVWGDGETSTTTSSGTVTLTKPNDYAADGDRTITVECSGAFNFGYGAYTNVGLFGSVTGAYTPSAKKILIGANTINLIAQICQNMYNLEYVSLPSNLTGSIGVGVFQNCYKLKAVIIPIGITGSINNSCFNSNLKNIIISLPPNMTGTLGSNSFNYCRMMKSIILPRGLTGAYLTSFNGCYSLERMELPDGLTGNHEGFSACYNLKYLKWSTGITGGIANYQGSGLTTITTLILSPNLSGSFGINALNGMACLETLALPSGLTGTLGQDALSGNTSLKSLTIPLGITALNSGCFQANYAMEEYIFQSATPPTMANSNVFTGISATCKIYVPDANVNDYKTATNWVTYANQIYPISTRP